MKAIGIALLLALWMVRAPIAIAQDAAVTHQPTAQCHATIADAKAERLAGFCYEQFVVNAAPDSTDLLMVVALHWMRSTPAEFKQYFAGLRQPARVVLLQGPYPQKEGFSFFATSPRNYYRLPAGERQQQLLEETDKLARFLAEIAGRYPASSRPVLIGASQGGDLSYAVAVRHPTTISLAVPLLAILDERIMPPAARSAVPIHAFHGTDDPVVAVADARKYVSALQQSGYEARLQEYSGLKHDISGTMQRDYLDLIDKHLVARSNAAINEHQSK